MQKRKSVKLWMGWFRDRALQQLYVPQQRTESLLELQIQTQVAAESAMGRLAIVNSVTIIGGLLGIIVWLALGVQRFLFPDKSLFSPKSSPREWPVNWPGETTWEVMILWVTSFVAISQVFLPIALQRLGIVPTSSWSFRDQAMFVLIPYMLSMSPMLPILSFSLQQFTPLPKPWFRFGIFPLSWLRWGILGYVVAVPLVVIVSLLSQQLLQGQGGGNPLLPILVESQDSVAKFILWVTVAIAAPFFEELLFRGFLLPSLTKLTSFLARDRD
ncbi:MAG: CPBP family intramembrane metalloprotease [Pseudanabaena sp. SU_2_4]|nr:CPBP family intramembrane metalloprotease [Pseudanabaena sp. SU_2_4]